MRTTARHRAVKALTVVTAVVAGPAAGQKTAWAWGTIEHKEIGSIAYAQACADLGAAPAVRDTTDLGVRERFQFLCGNNVAVLARLYGDATAVAGDFLGHPSEFLTHVGAWRFSSKKYYYLLALENSEHFNPMATRSWRSYHQEAIALALTAGHEQGLASVGNWELAVYESAFADHYLHDSFASGHMGFNRPASSAAAAVTFHNAWNARGRIVTDRAGRRWQTYGDGRLDSPGNEDGRAHVIYAATMSVHHLLRAFVLGQPSPDEELAIWRAVPFTVEAPELFVGATELFTGQDAAPERQLEPLLAMLRPARKDTVLDTRVWSLAPFEHPSEAIVAAVAGFDLAVPRLPVQGTIAGGATLREAGGGHSAVLDTGVLVPLGLSVDGLISHQLNVTASWIFRSRLATALHAEYQGNVELGPGLITLQVGLSELFPGAHFGWYGSLGLGYTFTAAGGGAF
jgi:hypothetical protein